MGLGRRVLLTALELGYCASLTPAWRRFKAQAKAPEATQLGRLKTLLAGARESQYGRKHGFDAITDLAGYQSKVPVVTYEDLRPWVDKIGAGEARVLTLAPVKLLERTSGSTGGNKLIPYTAELLREFSAATGPWLYSLYRQRPKLWGTTSYWSISPVTHAPQKTPGGLPIGIDDDTEYFDPLSAWALRQMLAVPGQVRQLQDLTAWRMATARHLLANENLGFISVWSPSFLTLILELMARAWDELLAQLPPRRAQKLSKIKNFNAKELWPRLQVVSTWTDGQAAALLPALLKLLGPVEIQGKGLLATEGVVSFPLSGVPAPGPVAVVGGPFLEFIDLNAPQKPPLMVSQLQVNGVYSPLLSTGGGFYRYDLRDQVRCVGLVGALPCLRFEGKRDRTCDLVGEKLSAPEVEAAFRRVGLAGFGLLCPGAAPHYRLYTEDPRPDLGPLLDQILAESHHYGYARKLGQLGPLVVVRVTQGWQKYEAALVARGVRAGDIKPTPLDKQTFWGQVFEETHGRQDAG